MTLAADTLKTSNTIYFWTVWFSIILFVLGKLLFVGAFMIFEPQIDGVYFHIIEHRATLKTSTCFSLVLFLIPIFITVTWRLGLITSLKRKIASAFFILLFIAVGIYARAFRRSLLSVILFSQRKWGKT